MFQSSMAKEKDVSIAVEALRVAMIDADEIALRDRVSDALSYGHSNGNVEDKTMFVKNIVTGKDVFKSIELYDHVISVVDDMAIARHRFKADVVVSGTPISNDIGVLQIWRLEGGKWRLLARQAFK